MSPPARPVPPSRLPAHVSWTVVNVSWTTVLTAALAAGGLAGRTPVAVAGTAALAAACAVGVTVAAHLAVHRAPAVATLKYGARVRVPWLVACAAGLHVAWVVAVAVRPALLGPALAALGALAGLEWGVTRLLSWVWAHEKVAPPPAATRPERAVTIPTVGGRLDPAAVPLARAEELLLRALRDARLGWLRVTETIAIRGGWRFEVQVTSAAQEGKTGTARTLGPANAEALAIALQGALGVRLRTDWVQVTGTGYAGSYHVSVVTEDTRAAVIPYVDDPTSTSITVPCPIGYQLDGTLVAERLDQHGQTVGKTRWGKTSLGHRKAAHLTRCVDAEWWVCGTEKLYDTLAGWLAPYEAHDRKTPVDYVAYGLADTLELLVGAMRLARYRQKVPLARRRPWHKIVIMFDEAWAALENTTLKVMYDGKLRTAADLVAMLTKGAGSGQVFVHTYNQRGTNDQLGDQGGTVKANSGFVEVFNTQDPDELGRAFQNWKLARPRHKGVFWVNVGEGGDGEVVQLKGEYLQEVDPDRDHLHEGATVSTVSWARRDLVREEPLDAAERAAVGDAYARRPRTGAAQVAYLTGEPPPATGGGAAVSEADEAYAAATAALDALLGPREPARGGAVAGAVATPPSLRRRVLAALNARPGASVGDLVEALGEAPEGSVDEAAVRAVFRELFDEEVRVRAFD